MKRIFDYFQQTFIDVPFYSLKTSWKDYLYLFVNVEIIKIKNKSGLKFGPWGTPDGVAETQLKKCF